MKALRTYDRYRAALASRTCAFSGSGDAAQKIKNRASGLGAPNEAAEFSPPPCTTGSIDSRVKAQVTTRRLRERLQKIALAEAPPTGETPSAKRIKTIDAEAGLGKTRLVFEFLQRLKSDEAIVLT